MNAFVDNILYYKSGVTPELAIAAATGGAELTNDKPPS
jgi:hypothetical protein